MKPTIALIAALTAASLAPAQNSVGGALGLAADTNVRLVIGLDATKPNTMGKLTVKDGVLNFNSGKTGATVDSKVPVSSIDDIAIGTETTQIGGKTARVIKAGAIAAPFESGRALSVLMRAKVDILTISFHDPDGGVHGAIFAFPIGQAEPVRAQLIQAGAHASPIEK